MIGDEMGCGLLVDVVGKSLGVWCLKSEVTSMEV